MLSQPEGVEDADLIRALAVGWGFDAAGVEYAAVGFGSYHWIASDAAGERRFVTVDIADGDRLEVLRRAFDTAIALLRHGLELVAPLPTTGGEPLRRLDDRHSIAVLPFVEGTTGEFGRFPDRVRRGQVLELLIELHLATGRVRDVAPVIDIELAERPAIVAAIHALDQQPWTSGPYSERTRTWLLLNAADVSELVKRFDGLLARVTDTGVARVITHGEPHPGNVLDTGERLLLIDWDTVGLALPERDLWFVADDEDERERYADDTGHRPDRDALELYALRWQLADIGIALDLLRSPHVEGADTEESWLSLDRCLQVARSL